ncbi:pyridoxamine 5'-phosphate oxidase family protein [Streptomyces sp. WAC 06783]|uniref:pyridoxamine 5'-phosphate oxidase family protein n=1 Tax=Streptomyces sp. WAC 06783 TaxID=2203211 RepID=UPI000F73B00E|nr:pyridoxamine 5'-phosphate oxidase family protein [Streptomyces sp. WAC 06783]RSO05368.1 pyridoxamine 5'-phosphate oxidase family protein [Streptomyces sp. WAC 06783]
MSTIPDLRAEAARLLHTNRYLTLGTASPGGAPWTTPVTYAWDDADHFYWWSASDAVHSRNIAANPAVSLLVFDSQVSDAEAQALYGEGTAHALAPADLPTALAVFYARRYPDPAVRAHKARKPAEFQGDSPKRFYCATIHTYSALTPDPHPVHGNTVPHRLVFPFTTAWAKAYEPGEPET